jgi:hypothetical protein
VLLLATTLSAQVGGTVLGYVASDSEALRPMLGIPGATAWGGPLSDLPQLEPAAVSNRHGYELGVADTGEAVLVTGLAGTPQATKLGAGLEGADRVVLSPTETAAAFYSSATGTISVWTGLPLQPSELWTAAGPASIGSLAVSDDGEAVLAATLQGLWAISSSGPRFLASADPSVSVAFFTGSDEAVVADPVANEVRLLRTATGASEPLAGVLDGVVAPTAVAVTGNNRYVVVNASPNGVLMISMEDRSVQQLACRCAPSELKRLNGTATFRLTGAPVYVLDGDVSPPRILSIPPPTDRTTGDQRSHGRKGGSQ